MKSSHPYNHTCTLTLLGNLVAKPEIRYQANPVIAIAEFVIATHKKWFDKQTQKTKEWTHYHTVKMLGDVVEKSLIFADKGDIILIKGHLVDSQKSSRQIIHATYAKSYAKGFAPSMNQLNISGVISSDVKLVETEKNKQLAECEIESYLEVISPSTQAIRQLKIKRLAHVWGKQATLLANNAKVGNEIIIDASLGYLNDSTKNQLIDINQLVLPKSKTSNNHRQKTD